MAGELDRAERIASAQASGTAVRYANGRATRDEALADITRALAAVDPDRRAVVLNDAAVLYVQAGTYQYEWDELAAELLREAGADLDEARAVWLRRFPKGEPPPSHRIGRPGHAQAAGDGAFADTSSRAMSVWLSLQPASAATIVDPNSPYGADFINNDGQWTIWMACTLAGSLTAANPLSSATNPMPALAACRLAHTLPLIHSLAVNGKYEQNFRKNGPKSSSRQYTQKWLTSTLVCTSQA